MNNTYIRKPKVVQAWFYNGRNGDEIIDAVNSMDKCSYKLVSINYESIKLPVLYLKGKMEVDINYDMEYRMCFPETWLVVEEYGDISFWDSFEFFMEYELLEV